MIEYVIKIMSDMVDGFTEMCELMAEVGKVILEIVLYLILIVILPIWIIPFSWWRRKKE